MMKERGVTIHIGSSPSPEYIFPQLYGSPRPTGSQPEVVNYPSLEEDVDPDRSCLYLHSSGTTGHPKSVSFAPKHMLEWFRYGTPIMSQISNV